MILNVLDIETTGTNKTADWIVQFAAIKVDTEPNKIIDKINLLIRPAESYVMGIGAYIKHHIHPDTLKDKPTFKEVAQQIYDFLNKDAILTYNGVSFDLPFLMNEFSRAGIPFKPSDYVCYDAFKEEQRRHSNKLEDAFTRYCGRTMEDAGLSAHDAFSDVKACYAVFRHQNETASVQPEELLTDDNMLTLQEFNGEKIPAFSFGRYKDVPISVVKQVDPSYITWILSTNICEKTRRLLTSV
jgi:DNA polymerase III subunit epsilon